MASLPQDRYRWMLLTGWFTLFSTIFAFVVAAPPRVPISVGVTVLVAMLAFVAYSVAMRRHWIALGLVTASVVASLIVAL